VKPKSEKAENTENALNMCEEPAINEVKHCATSVESMVDYVTLNLARTYMLLLKRQKMKASPKCS